MATPTSKIRDHIPLPKKRKTPVRRIRRILFVLAILLVLLIATGLLYQSIASAVDASTYPSSGRLVDVGGYRLHIPRIAQRDGRDLESCPRSSRQAELDVMTL